MLGNWLRKYSLYRHRDLGSNPQNLRLKNKNKNKKLCVVPCLLVTPAL